MRILLTGRNGQVGWELERALVPLGDVVATDRATLDLADMDAIRRVVRDVKPKVIVNTAAYTAVDRAESEPELAYAINATAPGVLAEEAKRAGALVVHYSTDYVFDGTKQEPYVEEDEKNPINIYGGSKLAGEQAISACGCRHLIFRTSWVYGPRGSNFLLRILDLATRNNELKVVGDQFGAPTTSEAIAMGTCSILDRVRVQSKSFEHDMPAGIYHMTCGGRSSWYEFAMEALEQLAIPVRVAPISSSAYPSRAKRPLNSILSNQKLARDFGVQLPHWREALESCLRALPGKS